jgi:uncharacterized protein (TIGR04255 family)
LDPQFRHSPDFILSNENYSLSFGQNVVLFENVSDYKLWPNYFPFIVSCLKGFYELGIIKIIDRIGVRFASVFDSTDNISLVINEIPAIPISKFNQRFVHYRCELKKDDITLHLQLADNAKITKKNKVVSGCYIDIDASFNQRIMPDENVFSIIDKLHSEQKAVFFGLLKESFLKTLDVKY